MPKALRNRFRRSDRKFAEDFNPEYHSVRNRAARSAYTARWTRAAGRIAGGAGALALSGLANLFAEVPDLESDPRVMSGTTLGRKGGHSRQNSAASMMSVQGQQSGAAGDSAGYVQLTRLKRTSGRKLARKAKLQKILGSLIQPVVTRFQNLQTLDAASGVCQLNFNPAATSPGVSKYPVWMFDLTSTFNQLNDALGGLYYPNVLYRLTRNRLDAGGTESNNQYNCVPEVAGVSPDGSTATYTWNTERRPRAGCYPMASTIFEWMDIRLMVYGAKKKPTQVYVDLVQFPEGMCPGYYAFTNTTGATDSVPTAEEPSPWAGGDDDARKWNEMWLGYVDRLVTNPLNKRDAFNVPGPKVVQRQVLTFNPTASFEDDPRGHMKELRLFKNVNKRINYQWANEAPIFGDYNVAQGTVGVAPAVEGNPNRWDCNGWKPAVGSYFTSCQVAPAPKHRLFLMISATSAVDAAFSADDHASFDFLIRRKQSVIGNT